MTAVKHVFEEFDTHRFRRFKTEKMLEHSRYSVNKFCQTVVNPRPFPRHPFPQDTRPYAIPAHSRWFSFSNIHNIERAQFPELSDPNEAKVYKRIRNKMVKLFRLYPTIEVTPSTIRHLEGGDFTKILKIHQFLSLWGLINFIPRFSSDVNQLYQNDTKTTQDSNLATDYSKILEDQSLSVNSNLQRSQQYIDITCSVCKAICSDGHFCSRKYPGVVICPQCFSQKNTLIQLEVPHSAFEFRTLPYKLKANIGNQMKPEQQRPKTPDDEIIYAHFESLKQDWRQISDKTEDKSPLDCLIIFLRSSFSDATKSKRLTNTEFNDPNPLYELLEFADSKNEENEVVIEYHHDWNQFDDELQQIEESIRDLHSNLMNF